MAETMDRAIARNPLRSPQWRFVIGVLGVVLLSVFCVREFKAERSVRVSGHDLAFAVVTRGTLHDFIPLRTKVVSRNTILVDTIDGGRVERIMVNPGDIVTTDQPLVAFSNTQLELTVLEKESQLVQSITLAETYKTQLEQYHLNNETIMAEIDWNIARLGRLLPRRTTLASKGVGTVEAMEDTKDEYEYWMRRKPLQEKSNREQETIRVEQLPQIDESLKIMQKDLQITRSKLENLSVRAPAAGRITSIDLKMGQTLSQGNRIAEITPNTGFKLVQEVDEYYLPRLRIAQTATVVVDGQSYTLRVARIYPQIKNGTFTVDLEFDGSAPQSLLPGQTIQGKLELGGDVEATIAPTGNFLQATGGKWVFVLDQSDATARRRTITIGKRNAEQLEILSGLQPGERFVASDYSGFDRIDRINITD